MTIHSCAHYVLNIKTLSSNILESDCKKSALFLYHCSLFRKKRFDIKFFVRQNASKFAIGKDSYSTANESKQQFNRFIIYCLNIVPMVNDSLRKKKKECKNERRRGSISRRLSVPYAIQSSNQLSYWDCWWEVSKIMFINYCVLFSDQICCFDHRETVIYSRIQTVVFTIATLSRY